MLLHYGTYGDSKNTKFMSLDYVQMRLELVSSSKRRVDGHQKLSLDENKTAMKTKFIKKCTLIENPSRNSLNEVNLNLVHLKYIFFWNLTLKYEGLPIWFS